MKRLAGFLVLSMLSFLLNAQTFPSKPVRIFIPFSPGGSADLQARTLGQKLGEQWGQTVLVESKPGAGTTIGAAYAAGQPADGYTLYFAGASLLISSSLYRNLTYDPVKSFAPVSMVADSPYMLAVNPSVPAQTLKELIDLAKTKPKTLTYASAGNGSGSHLAGELFRMLTGTDIVHVPYKGQAPALVALVAGEVNMLFADVAVNPLLQAGKLRALAETSGKRSTVFPNVPTISEAGLRDYHMTNWGAILAPAAIPKAIVTQLNAAIVNALKDPDVRARFASQGFEAGGSTPEALGELLVAEQAKYVRVIKQSGMKID